MAVNPMKRGLIEEFAGELSAQRPFGTGHALKVKVPGWCCKQNRWALVALGMTIR